MLTALAATYVSGVAVKLDQSVPERFRYYGIPVAVSADRYGLPGYVAYAEIENKFANSLPIDQILSEHLPAVLPAATVTAAARGEGLFFVPADDKGDVTYTRLAFWLFGPHAASLYQFYFVLIGLSALAFAIAFHGGLERLFVGLCATLALWGLVSAFRDDLFLPNAVTLYDPRILGTGAILAFLHLGFSTTQALTPIRVICLTYQTWLLLFVIHVRFDNVWLLMALAAWLVAAAVARRHELTRSALLRIATPIVLVVAGLGGLLAWERAVYHPRYFTSHMAHHLIWHNAGLGFVVHPGFARTFAFPASDGAMMDRTARYLLARGQQGAVAEVFGAAYSNPTGTPDGATINVGQFLHSDSSDIARYDSYAKEVIIATALDQPGQTLALYLYYKPRYALAQLLWFMGVSRSTPALLQDGSHTPLMWGDDAAPRAPVSVAQVLVFALGLLTILSRRPILSRAVLLALAPLVLFSGLPLIVAYPAPFLMAPAVLATTLTLYVALALVVTGWLATPSMTRNAQTRGV